MGRRPRDGVWRHTMFDEIDGLPLHPLAVHAPIVLIPLSALLGILYVVPKTRAWARIPFLVVAIGTVPAVYVARQSGAALKEALALGGEVLELVDEHQSRANVLFYLVIAYAVVAVLAFVADRSAGGSKAVSQLLSVLVIVGAVAVTY